MLTFYEFPKELRALVYTNNRIESFNKQKKRMIKKQIQFVSEEALEKRIVSMALNYNEDIGKRKVKCWRSKLNIMSRSRQNSDCLIGTIYTRFRTLSLTVLLENSKSSQKVII